MMPARDVEIVAGVRRRLAAADPVTLANFAWFAARRGVVAVALEAARHAASGPAAPPTARRALERLSAGRRDGLCLTEVDTVAASPARAGAPGPVPGEAELLQRGRHLLDAGRLPEALAAFDQLLAGHPAHSAALFHRGVVLAKLRRYAEALHAWEAVGHADPDGPLGAISRRHARSARELASLFGAS